MDSRQYQCFVEPLINADYANKTDHADQDLHDRVSDALGAGGVEFLAAAYTRQQMGAETYDAVTKLIDPFDLYLYPALADSERRMIDLINAGRPQKAGAA